MRSGGSYLTFQFHYGSIKMALEQVEYHKTMMFQFHYGSIKIIGGATGEALEFVFQFHYGSIKIRGVGFKIDCCAVSIPLWFD